METLGLAEKRLGAKFDVRKFHDLVLQGGSMPLSVLEEVVKDWLDQQQLLASAAPSPSPAHAAR